jgi:hypothetical protein
MPGNRTLIVVAMASLTLAGCGGGGGASKVVAEPVAQSFDDWVRSWRGGVRTGARPNEFRIPSPPVITELSTTADEIGRSVDDAATTFSDELVAISYDEAKRVFCHWYGWYLQTGATVPSEDEFPGVLLQYGFGRVLTSPPSLRLRSGIESFRQAIQRGQNEVEDVAYASIAAACA